MFVICQIFKTLELKLHSYPYVTLLLECFKSVASCSQAPWLTWVLNHMELSRPVLLLVQRESNRKLAAAMEDLHCIGNTFPSTAMLPVCQSAQ